jgi:hypothetical protein
LRAAANTTIESVNGLNFFDSHPPLCADAATAAAAAASEATSWATTGDHAGPWGSPDDLPTYPRELPAGIAAQCWAVSMPYLPQLIMMAASQLVMTATFPGQQPGADGAGVCSGCPPAAAQQQHLAAPTTDAAADADAAAHQSPAPALRASWQSEEMDTSARLRQAQRIIEVLRDQGLQHTLGAKFADAVRLLELMLYRTAPSKNAYLDAATLEARIVRAVRQRQGAAAARRLRLQSADCVLHSAAPTAAAQPVAPPAGAACT